MTETVSVRVEEDLLEAIERSAPEKNRSEIVREALQLWIARRELAEKVRRHREGYSRKPVSRDELGPVLGAQAWPR